MNGRRHEAGATGLFQQAGRSETFTAEDVIAHERDVIEKLHGRRIENSGSATKNMITQSPDTTASGFFERSDKSRTFTAVEVIAQEREAIQELRRRRSASFGDSVTMGTELIGLTLSGGGIRSATFNLGILQALAKNNILEKLDYLSTVSGGGYIGSWLTAWIYREPRKLTAVRDQLASHCDDEKSSKVGRYQEPDPIRFLRRYTSYLTPKMGLISGDTWAAAAIYLRNLLLNQAALVSLAAAALAACYFVTVFWSRVQWGVLAGGLLAGSLLLLVSVIAFNLANLETGTSERAVLPVRFPATFCIALHLLSAFLLSLMISEVPDLRAASARAHLGMWALAIWGALAYSGLCLLYIVIVIAARGNKQNGLRGVDGTWRKRIVGTPLAGAVGAYLLYFCQYVLCGLKTKPDFLVPEAVFAVPLVLFAIALIVFLHIGLMGREFADAKREWLARATGISLLLALVWLLLFGVMWYSPPLADFARAKLSEHTKTGKFLGWFLPGGWIATTVGGLFAAKSPNTDGKDKNAALRLLFAAAPPVFVLGVLVLVAALVGKIAIHRPQSGTPTVSCLFASQCQPDDIKPLGLFCDYSNMYWLNASQSKVGFSFVLLGGGLTALLLLGWTLDVNEFSMHLFYRNRLVRAYLGASHKSRRPNLFTGFDMADDLPLADVLDRDNSHERGFDGPYPIINTALNLVAGKELAWQERKATSFIYSPLFCGYDYFVGPGDKGDKLSRSAYRPTRICTEKPVKLPKYLQLATRLLKEQKTECIGFTGSLGPHLGTAMAASGAAASPNQGYHSSPAMAVLMTFFNIRLGWWVGNPRHESSWMKYGPKAHYLLYELIGRTDDTSWYTYLSDGGHFENLGLYELVRRRVKFIVVSDADQDGEFSFGDLGNAIEKCRADFGVEIDIQPQAIRPTLNESTSQSEAAQNRISSTAFVVGKILYPEIPGQTDTKPVPHEEGWLLYIKATLLKSSPADVLSYAVQNSAFPHDPTANQFFTERQFESYRALGESIGTEATSWLINSSNWHSSFRDQYSHLQTSKNQKETS